MRFSTHALFAFTLLIAPGALAVESPTPPPDCLQRVAAEGERERGVPWQLSDYESFRRAGLDPGPALHLLSSAKPEQYPLIERALRRGIGPDDISMALLDRRADTLLAALSLGIPRRRAFQIVRTLPEIILNGTSHPSEAVYQNLRASYPAEEAFEVTHYAQEHPITLAHYRELREAGLSHRDVMTAHRDRDLGRYELRTYMATVVLGADHPQAQLLARSIQDGFLPWQELMVLHDARVPIDAISRFAEERRRVGVGNFRLDAFLRSFRNNGSVSEALEAAGAAGPGS